MATAADEMAPFETYGDGEKSPKRRFRPGIKESQNASPEAGTNNSTGLPDQSGNYASISVTFGKPELEQMLKPMTFTRFETQRLKALLDSRTCDNAVDERDGTCLSITPMALPQQPMTIEGLSSDLQFDIFMRLLAKQLAQMRCVSKSWNALLSQSSFVKSYLHRSINNNNRILLVFYYHPHTSDPKMFAAYPCQSPHLELTNFIKLPPVTPKFGDNTSLIHVIGSVHGLICSSYGNDVIQIWNPSLSAVSTLPPYSCSVGDDIYFGFGYDPDTDDYKVVKLSCLRGPKKIPASPYRYFAKEWLQVEIYSMRKGCWKVITKRVPSHIGWIFKSKVCWHEGHLHWSGYIAEERVPHVIVAFALGSETFSDIHFPDSIRKGENMNSLGVLGGKLCVMSSCRWEMIPGIEMWVMDEYGVAKSWVMRHVFFLPPYDGGLFDGFTSHNEFIYRNVDDDLVLYDPIADEAKILEKSCNGKYRVSGVVEYIESLVWVAPSLK